MPVVFSALLAVTLLLVPPVAPGEGASSPDSPRDAASLGAPDSSYADHLVGEARRQRLHERPYWRTLLHYKRTIGGLRSLVDDPRFFASPAGKRDPAAELESTIRAFFEPDVGQGKHPVCRFVARYHWLKEQLGLDPARLPVAECRAFTRLVEEMRPVSATLVFAAAHMNSPASMFGHTFLVYETASRNKLAAQAVNYAAITGETFDPLYAVKGLFGLYKGYFSALPYYAKLQEYSDLDHRDMWEYPLALTREETVRSIMHVYEMEGLYADYYFFDENCSYTLLFLLDAARPGLHLTDQVAPWVIPLDTIRVAQEAGLIAEALHRPSRTTKIERLASRVAGATRDLALDIARGDRPTAGVSAAGLSNEEQVRALDLAVEYLQYLYSKRRVDRQTYTDRFVTLLAARSALGVAEADGRGAPPPRPEEGHRSNRLRLGAGLRKGQAFQEIAFRFAYHTLSDYPKGYREGSQIVFGDTAVRYYFEDHRLTLEYLDVLDIVSLAPRDELFQPMSWKVRAGLGQRVMEDGADHLIGRLSPGAGLAYRIPVLGLLYVMLEAEADVGDSLRENYALGVGGSVGVVKSITDRWTATLSARGIYFGLGDRHGVLDVTLRQNYALTSAFAISLDLSRNRTRDFYRTEGTLALNLFF
jgi:hypothetical protein